MLILARELRGVSQTELAEQVGMKQPRIAKLEIGHGAEISEDEMFKIAHALRMPVKFFYQSGDRVGFGTSEMYTRTRQMVASEKKRISGVVNVLRLQIKKMLDFVEIGASRQLPRMSVAEYGSAGTVALAVRSAWGIPSGPVKNVTKLLEAAGVIVVECDFGTSPIDATSIVTADMPPCIFMNKNVPGDRWRFTLAHELAHIVMHSAPHPAMEEEADEFASEFLMPSEDIAPMLAFGERLGLEKLVVLKEIWNVSIAALVMKAETLRKITPNQKKWIYALMNKHGIRISEPAPLARERTSVFESMLGYFRETANFSEEVFADMVMHLPEELSELYDYAPRPNRVRLRVV
jgi:Zn-dependent peptidase ImmA (M78 family)/transcriptional regulator with XRE-family HTH domain